jgi:hypothetical protein
MRLKQLQKEYIQKSRIYLYPLLGIRRGVSITPIQTYMQWDKDYPLTSHKFITVYHLRDDLEFKQFEEKMLLGNPLFSEFFELNDGTAAYVFDFSEHAENYEYIVKGKYSLLSDTYKQKILAFFKDHHTHHISIHSYLEPKKFFNDYAILLDVSEKLLEEVGELCSPPNLNLEKLKIKKKLFTFDSVNNL